MLGYNRSPLPVGGAAASPSYKTHETDSCDQEPVWLLKPVRVGHAKHLGIELDV